MCFSFWCGFERKNYIIHWKYVWAWFLRLDSRLSLLSHTFSEAGFTAGSASSLVGELPGLHQVPAYISPVWHPATQWQRDWWLRNPFLMLEVHFQPLAGKQAAASLSCCIVIIHAFPLLPPCWHSCGRLNTPVTHTKLLDWDHRKAQWKSLTTQVWIQGGLWTAMWLCAANLVWLGGRRGGVSTVAWRVDDAGYWCNVAGTTVEVVGSHCPTLETEHPWATSFMGTSCLDEVKSFFVGSIMGSVELNRPPLYINPWN